MRAAGWWLGALVVGAGCGGATERFTGLLQGRWERQREVGRDCWGAEPCGPTTRHSLTFDGGAVHAEVFEPCGDAGAWCPTFSSKATFDVGGPLAARLGTSLVEAFEVDLTIGSTTFHDAMYLEPWGSALRLYIGLPNPDGGVFEQLDAAPFTRR